jgi:REP element-mobilizing transposase RayT
MIVAHHVIFGMYGFWLPNDPRGSWSEFVGSWELLRYGRATRVSDPRSHAHVEHDLKARIEAKRALKYPPVLLSGIQARAVATGFASYAGRAALEVYACAILPDHVHLVISTHRLAVEQIVVQLKASAARQLEREQVHPQAQFRTNSRRSPKCFARGEWKVFLDPEDVPHAVEYVRLNPVKEGLREQKWKFVVPWE